MKTGYSIKTWRMRLFCPEQDMLAKTEQLYQETVDFYYEILQTRQDIWKENLLSIQRELELLTVSGRDGRVPLYTPPHGKLPVYFRRSAMNKAGIAVKSAAVVGENQKKEIIFPEKIDASLTFFKGMYRDISDTSVKLKLWDGKKWKWISSQLEGRPFPVNGTVLSPSLSHNGKLLMLHVPVKQENSDARTAKERVQTGSRICSVQFTNTDIFAMCSIQDVQGKQLAAKACRGGNTYHYRAEQTLKKLEKSQKFTENDNVPHADQKHYMYLKHLNEHFAHKASREIVDFCKEQNADLIVLPVYGKDFSRIDQSEPIEHPVDVSHAPDITQSFRTIHHFFFYISKCQNYRTPCQTFTLLPSVDPQLLSVLAIPAFFNFVREWQPGVSFEFHTSIGQNHTPEVFFCRISPPSLHCSVSPLPLCSNTDFLFFCCTGEVHTFFIR